MVSALRTFSAMWKKYFKLSTRATACTNTYIQLSDYGPWNNHFKIPEMVTCPLLTSQERNGAERSFLKQLPFEPHCRGSLRHADAQKDPP